MNLNQFVSQFTHSLHFEDENIVKIKNAFFLVNTKLINIVSHSKILPSYMGIFLGREANARFVPSIFLLEMLLPYSKKAVVNKKAEWLYLCKRDVLEEGIVSSDAVQGNMIIVANAQNEILGYGRFGKNQVKNYFDLGDFLRRERKNI